MLAFNQTITAKIEISAPLLRVWEALTDLAGFSLWNPFIRRAAGEMCEGAKLELHLQIPDGWHMKIRPKILRLDPPRELRWRGRLIVSGLFDGEHLFQLQSLAPEKVRLIQRECFSGVLVPLLGGVVSRGALRGFHAMNEALRLRVETGPTASD